MYVLKTSLSQQSVARGMNKLENQTKKLSMKQ